MKRVELADTDLENLTVTTHPKFRAIMDRSQARYEAEGGRRTEQVRRRLAARRRAQRTGAPPVLVARRADDWPTAVEAEPQLFNNSELFAEPCSALLAMARRPPGR